MRTLIGTRELEEVGFTETGIGGAAVALRDDRTEPRWLARRCPDCGRLDHSDSELDGTCEICPGLVPLQPV